MDVFWWIVFTIFFAIMCNIIARNKNRDVVGWTIGGIMFGIFALLILIALPPKQPVE